MQNYSIKATTVRRSSPLFSVLLFTLTRIVYYPAHSSEGHFRVHADASRALKLIKPTWKLSCENTHTRARARSAIILLSKEKGMLPSRAHDVFFFIRFSTSIGFPEKIKTRKSGIPTDKDRPEADSIGLLISIIGWYISNDFFRAKTQWNSPGRVKAAASFAPSDRKSSRAIEKGKGKERPIIRESIDRSRDLHLVSSFFT